MSAQREASLTKALGRASSSSSYTRTRKLFLAELASSSDEAA